MDQSFDLQTISLSDAATMVAVRARIGSQLTKRADFNLSQLLESAKTGLGNAASGIGDAVSQFDPSNPLHAALASGGLGAGIGGLSALSSRKKRKPWLHNMLMGGLIGGGIGGGASMLANSVGGLGGENDNSYDAISKLQQKIQGGEGGPTSTGINIDNRNELLRTDGEPVPNDSAGTYHPELRGGEIVNDIISGDPAKGVGRIGGFANENFHNNPVSAIASPAAYGAAGYGLGSAVDHAAAASKFHRPVSPKEIRGLGADTINKHLGTGGGAPGTPTLGSQLSNAPIEGRFRLPPEGFRKPHERFGGVPLTKAQHSSLSQVAKGNRTYEPGRKWRRGGFGAGILAGLLQPWTTPEAHPESQ